MFLDVKKKISKVKINLQPFPYIFIKNIFDEKYVDKLNSFLPSYKISKEKKFFFKVNQNQKKLYCQVQLYIEII